ncbi:MAG: hypothetical protein ACXW00_08660 [Methylobacter sp.]
MSSSIKETIAVNELKKGDVVLTRSGANFGQCAPVITNKQLFACADLLVLRKGDLPGSYISTFLNTWQGRLLLDRGAYGMAQPHIAPTYVRTIPVPIFDQLIGQIVTLVENAEAAQKESERLLLQADRTFILNLGLENWQAPEPLSYTRSSRDVFTAGRLDAEHYQERFYTARQALLDAGALAFVPLPNLLYSLTNGHTPLRHDLSIGEVPLLCAEHITDFNVNFASEKRILLEHHEGELARTAIRDGDVLLTIKGRVGNAAIAENVPGNVNINQDVALLRLNDNLPPWYVIAFLNSRFGKLQTEQMSTGAINPFLGLFSIRQFAIPRFDAQLIREIGEETKKHVTAARNAKQRATQLLDVAKRAVEIAIEQDENASMAFIEAYDKMAHEKRSSSAEKSCIPVAL